MKFSRNTVAVMQPYFFPHAGYFRLFAMADQFVILDCVQFARRGRVHRCRIPRPGGEDWLTLPLARQPCDTLIRDLRFAADARARFDLRLRKCPWIDDGADIVQSRIRDLLFGPLVHVVDYLEAGLRLVCNTVDLKVAISRSSQLALDPMLKGQDRIIAIVKALGGETYINPPGGRAFYDHRSFADAGLRLRFLSSYAGRYPHLLPALFTEPPNRIRDDIRAQCRLT